jgi:hypothetical protein
MTPAGFPLWISDVEPGSVHDITAARAHALPALYRAAADLPTLADPGYEGAGIGILIPVKQPTALLTGRWRTLRHITAGPSKIGDIARAALVLTHFEHGYIT